MVFCSGHNNILISLIDGHLKTMDISTTLKNSPWIAFHVILVTKIIKLFGQQFEKPKVMQCQLNY